MQGQVREVGGRRTTTRGSREGKGDKEVVRPKRGNDKKKKQGKSRPGQCYRMFLCVYSVFHMLYQFFFGSIS